MVRGEAPFPYPLFWWARYPCGAPSAQVGVVEESTTASWRAEAGGEPMEHADPWDEIARLEKQMEVELLLQLERTRADEAESLAATERAPVDRTLLDPRK